MERYTKLNQLHTRWREETKEFRKGGFPILEEAAELLGLSEKELKGKLSKGRSLSQIAKDKGMSEAELTEKLLAARNAKLDEAVKAGKLTAERADEIKDRMKTRIGYMVKEKDWNGEKRDHHRHHGKGAAGHGLPHMSPEKLSSLIGIPKEELLKQLKAGKSLAEIAAEKGISKQELIQKIKDELTPALEKAVERKKHTEKR